MDNTITSLQVTRNTLSNSHKVYNKSKQQRALSYKDLVILASVNGGDIEPCPATHYTINESSLLFPHYQWGPEGLMVQSKHTNE